MTNADNTFPNRQSHRYKGYDYSTAGAYFVTFCIQGFHCLLGKIENNQMVMNDAGCMVASYWQTLPARFPMVALDEFCVMPNHIHLILWLQATAVAPLVGAQLRSELDDQPANVRPAPTLGDVIGAFKSITTIAYIEGVRQRGWPRFKGKIWQRDYWDRIIRDEIELENVRNYIRTNPARWRRDQLHPEATQNKFYRET